MEPRPTQSSAAVGGAHGTIFIKELTGTTSALDVCWDDTGADLKRKLIENDIFNGTVDQMRLIFGSKQLKDAGSLQHQGVTNHGTVRLVLSVRGGGGFPVRNFPAGTAQGREEAQPHSSSPDKAELEEQTRRARRAVASFRYSVVLKGKCNRCFGVILPEVTPEIVPGTEENKTVYRARIPSAGSFHCSETGLGFEVSTAVTIEYEYGSWAESLSPSARQEWMVAGPLFHIRAKPDTVRAVHLPHFLCLAGDVKIPAASSQTLTARGVSFVKKHREELRNRMGVIYPILARLRDIEAMNSDEEEELLSMRNRRKVMNDALLQLVERKGAQAQEELYQSLKETDPYLVQDLEQSS
ncbi:uncharacterized protein LOC141999413 [Natator depressus]|uniref:uncharacterized protein LOC141999413 n=1 Tax=Natator depressus TaxID=27790 RepID=UPI003EC1259E